MHQEPLPVYVVDDDDSVRKALKRLLRSVGYHAATFESAEDFIESVAPNGDKGCLILDISLPGMTGIDLLERLSASGGKLSVILMTAHDNQEWQQRAARAGALAYLKKPFDEQSLLEMVQLVCHQGSE